MTREVMTLREQARYLEMGRSTRPWYRRWLDWLIEGDW